MSYTAVITDTTTKERREAVFDDLEWVDGGSDYLWSDGNFGCDCNRALFFGRAINTPEDQIDEAPCGHTRFHVVIKVGDEVVYSDDEADV